MYPTPFRPDGVRSAAAVNEEIRGLWLDPRVQLSAAERAKLGRLYEEWSVAVQAEVVEAA